MPSWWGSSSSAPPAEEEAKAPASTGAGAASMSTSTSGSTAPSAAAVGASPPAAEAENPWEVNKPVERRTQALNEEAHDCLYCFWSWITCGGPGARMRQLYVNGKLSRCMDDYARLKNCLIFKMDPERDVNVIPGPHPVWHIRTRKQAAEFWQENYKHLRAGVPRPGDGVRGGADPDSGMLATAVDATGTSSSGTSTSSGATSVDRSCGTVQHLQAAPLAPLAGLASAGVQNGKVSSSNIGSSQNTLHG